MTDARHLAGTDQPDHDPHSPDETEEIVDGEIEDAPEGAPIDPYSLEDSKDDS